MTDYRQNLQQLLYKLFQFDSADLDFGFYAVMNKKREQISEFIDTDLLNAVEEGLAVLAAGSQKEAQAAFDQARQTVIQNLSEDALEGDTLQAAYHNTRIGKQFLQAQENLKNTAVNTELEARIFNDLYQFFTRYYQDGDFISQRRHGRNNKYAIPYNGEEVHLHWANFDQYYVKTGTLLTNYSFSVPGAIGLEGGASIQVKIAKVDVERDNIKGDKRFFVHAEDQSIVWDEETQVLTIPFEYRPLTSEENKKAGKGNPQSKLLEEAYNAILEALPNKTLRELLTQQDPQKRTNSDRLTYHLNRYAAENTRDYFVHKDLGAFLRRELDYYIKTEILSLDDINLDDPIALRRAGAHSSTIRIIAGRIITFLEQLETFQRRLFLKRKFVRQNDYCLTLDKISADARSEFYPEILSNNAQLKEWKLLYDIDITPDTNLDFYPHLMIDTAHFDAVFKSRLLGTFVNLDASTDGVIVNSENFQALRFLLPSYSNRISSIYIDPPYNRGEDDFIYKDNFRHSSWLSMMQDRLNIGYQLLSEKGLLFCSIDENEIHRLIELCNAISGDPSLLSIFVWRKRAGGDMSAGRGLGTSIDHEYVVGVAASENASFAGLPKDSDEFSNPDNDPDGPWKPEDLTCNKTAEERPNLYYDIKDPVTGNVYKCSSNRVWAYEPSKMEEFINRTIDGRHLPKVLFPEKPSGRPQLKKFLKERKSDTKPISSWIETTSTPQRAIQEIEEELGLKIVQAPLNSKATRELQKLMGGRNFPYPKSTELVQIFVEQGTISDRDYVLDFFAGSGTTAHAVMDYNLKNGTHHRYVLVEMSDYFDTILKPRLQKLSYSSKWQDGKPALSEDGQKQLISSGQSHMFQYIRLESYDDTYNNIRFRDTKAPLLDLPDYQLTYLLDHETAGSPTLLDIESFQRPFEYQLNITGPGGVLDPHSIDLVTTFNFLLGLAVQTIHHFTRNKSLYVRVLGTNPEGQRVCVLWRNLPPVEEMDEEYEWVSKTVLAEIEYDKLYVNADSTIPGTLSIEEEFKRRMFEGVH